MLVSGIDSITMPCTSYERQIRRLQIVIRLDWCGQSRYKIKVSGTAVLEMREKGERCVTATFIDSQPQLVRPAKWIEWALSNERPSIKRCGSRSHSGWRPYPLYCQGMMMCNSSGNCSVRYGSMAIYACTRRAAAAIAAKAVSFYTVDRILYGLLLYVLSL